MSALPFPLLSAVLEERKKRLSAEALQGNKTLLSMKTADRKVWEHGRALTLLQSQTSRLVLSVGQKVAAQSLNGVRSHAVKVFKMKMFWNLKLKDKIFPGWIQQPNVQIKKNVLLMSVLSSHNGMECHWMSQLWQQTRTLGKKHKQLLFPPRVSPAGISLWLIIQLWGSEAKAGCALVRLCLEETD